jgi:diguanylate cyclase (GGDEF)-like protein
MYKSSPLAHIVSHHKQDRCNGWHRDKCRIRHQDSKYYWSRITICNAKARGSAAGQEYLFLIQDIHDSKEKEVRENTELLRALCKLETEYHELFEENMTDSLSGCYNRKGFNYYEAFTLEEAKKPEKKLFVCVLDLNGLKHLNDTYGHEFGDDVLVAISDVFKSKPSEGIYFSRWGGEEFLIIFPDLNGDESCVKAHVISDEVKKIAVPYENDMVSVTMTYGLSEYSLGNSLEENIKEVDEKLYMGKNSGRNKIVY